VYEKIAHGVAQSVFIKINTLHTCTLENADAMSTAPRRQGMEKVVH
jgi:hypothetical protein